MAAPEPRQPFVPRSSRWLESGQDWAVPLSERTELLLQPVDQEGFNGYWGVEDASA